MSPFSQQKSRRKTVNYLSLMIASAILLSTAPAFAQEAAGQGLGGFLQGVQAALISTLAWIDSLGPLGPIAFILLYILVTVAFLPASVVTLGAGAVFGVVGGSTYVFIGAMLGATAAFLIGRYVARDWIAQKIAGNVKFNAIYEAISQEALKLIFLIRLSPAFPFNVLNYALGLTKASLKDYVLGTTGIIPGTIMYVYLGSLIGDLAKLGAGEQASNLVIDWIIRILILVTVVAITVYITRIARKALKEAVPETVEAVPEN